MSRLFALWAWAVAHQHRVLVIAGLLAEGLAKLHDRYAFGPAWLAGGHLAFVMLVSLGIISTSSKARVDALEAALDKLDPDPNDPYADVPTKDAKP